MVGPSDFWLSEFPHLMQRSVADMADVMTRLLLSVSDDHRKQVPSFATLNRARLDLPTMVLRDLEGLDALPARALIVAPFALHDATIADFATGHSIAEVLSEGGTRPVAVTHWKSASPEMSYQCIDHYLADLNVAVDDLGGRLALIGLCQGGWLAAAYAARFPEKVSSLVLAGAPIDLGAASSVITRAVAVSPAHFVETCVQLAGGRVLGQLASQVWSQQLAGESDPDIILQCRPDDELKARFAIWNAYSVDLPGRYFIQTTEWLFRENRLARGCFPALGRVCKLDAIRRPIFVLAARDDEIVAVPQATAVEALCPNAHVTLAIEQGKHLSLFLGHQTIARNWREILQWLQDVEQTSDQDRGLKTKPA